MTLRTALLTCLIACSALAQPRIFYSDLDSGPRNGGENDQGAFVTIYGRGFGANRGVGQVTIGGGPAASYPIWTDTKVAFQLGPAANSGEIRLTNTAGTSNGVPFTVRPGNILFIGANAGSGAVQRAVDTMSPGDIVYLRDGVREFRPGASDGSVTISRNSGTPGNPKALVGYPGATATIGQVASSPCTTVNCVEGLKTSFASNWWTIANLRLVGNDYGLAMRGTNWRVVGNDLTCPFGSGASACMDASQSSFIRVYGNDVHDAGYARSSALYHGIYFSTDSNNIDIGWNSVRNIQGCRGIQFNSTSLDATSGFNQSNLSVHDNLIDGTQCDGIVLSTVDPSQGPITIFNNVFVNAGRGPATVEGGGTFSCVYAAGYTGSRSRPGSGVIDVFNNTMINCGTFRSDNGFGGIIYSRRDTTIELRMRNNIIAQSNGTTYWTNFDGTVGLTGSNNLVFGNGAAPQPSLPGTITGDPRFVNAAAGDYRLSPSSPARGAGVNTGITTDKDGVLRGGTFDIGAYQVGPGVGGGGSTSFTVSATALEAGSTVGINPASQTLTIANSGEQPFDFIATLDRPWVTVSPARGTLARGASQTLTVAFNIAGLDAGTYSAVLRIGAGDSSRDIGVRLVVTPISITDPAMTLSTSTVNFSVADAAGGAPAPQVVRLRNIGAPGSVMRWTARADQPWVTVRPASGSVNENSAGQEVTITVDPAGFSNGGYSAAVIFEAEKTLNSPARLTVRLGVGAPTISSVVNAASFLPGIVAPRTLVSIFGVNLGPADGQGFELTPDGRNVRIGAGTRVLFDGVPAAVLYSQADQINAILPREAGLRRSVQVTVDNGGLVSPPVSLEVSGTSPAIFTLSGRGSGPAAALNADSTVNTQNNPAAPGSAVSFFATGLGELNPAPGNGEVLTSANFGLTVNVTVDVGGRECPVGYAGAAPGFVVGVYQINCQVPTGLASGEQAVVLRASGVASAQAVTLFVR